MIKLSDVQSKIDLVTNEILSRFPNCYYTVRIILWDDDTFKVECRHGTADKLYISDFYNNELSFTEIDISHYGNMMIDKDGNEYHRLY